MPTISAFYGILIQLLFNDHAPPHFHVRYGNFKARVSIDELQIISGTLPRSAERLVLEWAQVHQTELMGKLDIVRTSRPAREDRSPSIIPSVVCDHPDDVAQVTPLDGFRLHVRFFDGLAGQVDMSALVHSPSAGVFAQLADPVLFAQAYVEYGAVVWPGEIDLAPDAMYTEIKKSGEWNLK